MGTAGVFLSVNSSAEWRDRILRFFLSVEQLGCENCLHSSTNSHRWDQMNNAHPHQKDSPARIGGHRQPVFIPESPSTLIRRRRRARTLLFIVLEGFALLVMVVSAIAGISARFAAESWTPIFRVLPITAAAVAVILPIFFYGKRPRG
jgi:hypothetical protein